MAHILQFDAVNKSFFQVAVLRDVSFSLERGHILGLVGQNGAGKSTLMNILGGVLTADGGAVLLDGKRLALRNAQQAADQGIAFIHQELNLFPNLTIAENLLIPRLPSSRVWGVPVLNLREIQQRARQLLELVGLNLSLDLLVSDLSPGERQLIEIAKALNVDAKILILDEPTSSLTSREAERLFSLIERLRGRGMSMIYISHVLGDVLRLCDDICVLRDGEVVAHGPKSEFSSDSMISLMTGHDVQELYPSRESRPSQEPILDVRGISQPGVVKDISFTVHKGEVLGLFGLMGAGRTELARMIFGLDTYTQGEIALDGSGDRDSTPKNRVNQGMAFLTENRREEGLFMEASVAENVAQVALPVFARYGLVDRDLLAQAVTQAGASVGLSAGALQMREVRSLSGGNQQKVILSKWFLAHPRVLILDEPTRGVDVGAKYEIYLLINQYVADGGCLLLISSEIEELLGMCDRILVMRNGELCDDLARPEFESERILRSAFGAGAVQ
jgi:ribose transport system ATP-binding protein